MIDPSETQLYTTEVSILTIPRNEFWIFKSGILRIIYRIANSYGSGSRNRDSYGSKYDTDLSASLSLSDSDNDATEDNSIKSDDAPDSISVNSSIWAKDDGLFFHLAFAEDEVTLMCASKLIDKYLAKPLEFCKDSLPEEKQPAMIGGKFLILQVFSDGLNIGRKILELTAPLSLDGISLFFISNFFSDIVLFPESEREKVLGILEHALNKSNSDAEKTQSKQEEVLEKKTFELFKSEKIKPEHIENTKLLLTGARSGGSATVLKQTAEAISKLSTSLSSKNSKDRFPVYFAITRTTTGEISLMLPQKSSELSKLNYDKSTIMGSLQDSYCPVSINLRKLPLDLKGIVAGVAAKFLKLGLSEMSYLSFGRSGMVLVPDDFRDTVELVLSRLNL